MEEVHNLGKTESS